MKLEFRSRTLKIIASVLMAGVLLFGVKKILLFAAEPDGPKDCHFVYPENIDQEKPTTLSIELPRHLLDVQQSGGVINDASCLNKTAVHGIINIRSVEDVQTALAFAKEHGIKITPSGERHSMGGQSFVRGGLVLDMRSFNKMQLSEDQSTLTVESGASWQQVQEFLDPFGLSVKAMQSINIFSIGGTLSVNAHGIAHNPGQVAPTVKAMRILTASGDVVTASGAENTELFSHVLGGYGLFGIILDVDLDVVPNEMYSWETVYMNASDYPKFYREHIASNPDIGLTYARLSPSPTSYLNETAVHVYRRMETDTPIPAIQPEGHTAMNRLVINASKTGGAGRWMRWMLEKYLEPRVHMCSRNQAMSQKDLCLVSRNQEMYDSMGYLKNKLADTDLLQEYFIPQENMVPFVAGLREIVRKNNVNLLNVTIRIVSKDDITALAYAPEDRFAFVLYFNQKFTLEESEKVKKTASDLIDLATSLDGSFYLPYNLYYTKHQLESAYPNINAFFETKRMYDPDEIFGNTFYEKYGR